MRRPAALIAWTLGGAALLVLLSVAALIVAGHTASGRTLLESLTARLTSGGVLPDGLEDGFPAHLRLRHLRLADSRGVWLEASDISVDWSPLALLQRRLQLDSVHAAAVDVQRLPVPSPQRPAGAATSMPRIDAGTVVADRVTLGSALAGAPATLALRGAAHLRSMRDVSIDATARRLDGDGDYALQLQFDPARIDGRLQLREPASGPLQNLVGLPGLGALSVTVTLDGPRDGERLDLSLQAGAARGSAHGRFSLTDLSADLDFALDSPALAPRPDIAWQRIALSGHWHGALASAHADAQLQVDQLRMPGGLGLRTLRADLHAAAGVAGLDASIVGLQVPGPRPALLGDAPLTLHASLRLDDPHVALQLTAAHRLFTLQGTAQTTAGLHTAAVELQLPDLAPLAALLGQQAGGSATVTAGIRGRDRDWRIDVDARSSLETGAALWAGPAGPHPRLQLTAALSPGSVLVEALRLTGRSASLQARGELDRQGPATLKGRWDLELTDLKSLSPALAGTLRADGLVSGTPDALDVSASARSTLSMHDSPSGTLSADVAIRGLPAAATGTAQVRGLLDAAPLRLDVALARVRGGGLHVVLRRADWKSARGDGDFVLASAAAPSHGRLHLQVERLADLQRLTGVGLGGSLDANVSLRPAGRETETTLHLDARDLAVGGFTGNLQLSGAGPADAIETRLDVQARDLHGVPASLSATGAVDIDARRVRLASGSVGYRGQVARVTAPAVISVDDGVAIDSLRLGAQDARLDLSGRFSPVLDLRASLRGLRPALINAFSPVQLDSGSVDGDLQLYGNPASPTGEVHLAGRNLRSAEGVAFGLPAVEFHANARLADGSADIDAALDAGAASHLSLTGRAPLAADGTLDLKLAGSLDAGIVNPLLEARGQHASGRLLVDASVAGSYAAPRIGGTLALDKGSFRDYVRGLSLTDIRGQATGSDGTLQIRSLTAASRPGTVTVTGSIGVLQPGWPLELSVKAVNAQPVATSLVTATVDADLRVSGTLRERLDVAGRIDVNRALIGIPNGMPPNVAVLDVRRRGKAQAPAPVHALTVGLDLAVHAPHEILVQGRGLDVAVGGDLQLTGTTDAPLVHGGFDLQRGTFSLASTRLNFTPPGGVTFNGTGLKHQLDPSLDFTAQTTVSGVTVTLRVSGYADAPLFEFTSNQGPNQQDEIMALLLFGQHAASLSALQLAQIGAALATLGGVGGDGGLNPLVRIQKTLGLDRLAVGSTGSAPGAEGSGTSIEAGRYVSRRVYLVAKQSTTGTSQLEANVDLTRHLKLQTKLGNGANTVVGTTPENDPGSSIGLSWQVEY